MSGLYHYTTGTGLLGMLKNYSADNPNITMWATHYMYMNDPIEYTYGQNICLDIIDLVEEELNIPKIERVKEIVLSKEYNDLIKSARFEIDIHKSSCPYIISLSQAYDSLYMWKMYAVNGNGLAIKFDEVELIMNLFNLKKCVYHKSESVSLPDSIKQQIKESYMEFAQEMDKAGMNTQNNQIYKAHYIFTLISVTIGICIKSSAYQPEQEVRITPRKEDKNILFRERNGIIIPYIEQSIPFSCIESITVGPTADFDRVRESILLFLKSKGINWGLNNIIKSEVPYRI